jgi:hypothetical protein
MPSNGLPRILNNCRPAGSRNILLLLLLFYYYYYFLLHCSPAWVMVSSFTRFSDHPQRRATVGRTPLDEWAARRRNLSLTTHKIDKHPHAPDGSRTHYRSRLTAIDLRLRPRGPWDRQKKPMENVKQTSRCMRPKGMNKWPNCMLARWWWWWFFKTLHYRVKQYTRTSSTVNSVFPYYFLDRLVLKQCQMLFLWSKAARTRNWLLALIWCRGLEKAEV